MSRPWLYLYMVSFLRHENLALITKGMYCIPLANVVVKTDNLNIMMINSNKNNL